MFWNHKLFFLLCFSALPVFQLQAEITRGPYLQNGSTTSMTVMWRSKNPATGSVTFLATDEYSRSITTGVTQLHSAVLTNLKPGATYSYQVVCDGSTAMSYFTTYPCETGTVRIAVIGDLQLRHEYQKKRVQALCAWLADQKPHAIITVGDAVHDSEPLTHEYWQEIFTLFNPLFASAPVYLVTGNHDTKYGLCPGFYEHFSFPLNGPSGMKERVYSFTCGPAHIAAGSIHYEGGLPHLRGTAQFNWLSNNLAQADAPWKVFVLHNPVISGGKSSPFRPPSFRSTYSTNIYAAYLPWIQEHSVDLVLQGHEHCYERSFRSNTTYLTTTTIKYDYDGPNPWSRAHHPHGYALLSISPDKLVIEGIAEKDNAVEIFDREVITKKQ